MADRFDYEDARVYAIGMVNDIEITVIYTVYPELKGELFRRGDRSNMKDKHIGRSSVKDVSVQATSDWNRVRSMTDRQIRHGVEDDKDAHPTDAKFWETARVVLPEAKKSITIRLDSDLLEWFRKQKGYQTRINAVLRTYMEASTTSSRKSRRTRSR